MSSGTRNSRRQEPASFPAVARWDHDRPHRPELIDAVRSIREAVDMEAGERMLLWCDGGPSQGRATTYPPPMEIDVAGGVYVLVDDGPVEQWHYAFVDDSSYE